MKRGLTSVTLALLAGGVVVFLAIKVREWDDRLKALRGRCADLRAEAVIAKVSLLGRERKVNKALEVMGEVLRNLDDSLRAVRKTLTTRDEEMALEFRKMERDLRSFKTSLRGALLEMERVGADVRDMKPVVDRMKGLSLQLESAFRRGSQ